MKVHRKLRLHHIAFGLTVCLATCSKLVVAKNHLQTLQQNNSSKWIPVTNSNTSSALIAAAKLNSRTAANESIQQQFELNQLRECCARLLGETDKDKARDILEVAASVMAPIERMPMHQNTNSGDYDDEQEDEQDDAVSGVQEEPQSGQRLAEEPRWRPQNQRLDEREPGGRQQVQQRNSNDNNSNSVDRGESEIDPVAAEQEAAEASEAEAADRSALDEQLQQQQEIIRAQAASEAKAIREQQEALLRQQQMQLRMSHGKSSQDRYKPSAAAATNNQQRANNNQQRRPLSARSMDADGETAAASISSSSRMKADISEPTSEATTRMYHRASINQQHQHPVDIQFSDQPDRKSLVANAAPFSSLASMSQQQAVLASSVAGNESAAAARMPNAADGLSAMTDDIGPTLANHQHAPGNSGDLHAAAQHHYGSHYGSVKGHHGDYYQFAESHKKGQFHSGFKRGGKKFQISGHASQHKSHAEGHVNWHGKKGKGVQYWDYKHKNKKQHGHYH